MNAKITENQRLPAQATAEPVPAEETLRRYLVEREEVFSALRKLKTTIERALAGATRQE